jgi:hypothetical protein
MATQTRPDHERGSATADVDYLAAEGIARPEPERERARREWTMVAVGLAGLVAILALVLGAFALAHDGSGDTTTIVKRAAAPAAAAPAKAPTLADAKGIAFEKFEKVDPTLPPAPPGPVKKFTVDQPVQDQPDHGASRRADPHVRPGRRPEQVERLPRHRDRLRQDLRRRRRGA